MARIYFDTASTTPVDPRVLDAMRPYFTEIYGNPSSILVEEGSEPRKAVDGARAAVADLLNAAIDEIIFTGSATESNNLAVKGLALANRNKGNKVLFSDIEHYSIMHQADALRAMGFDVDYVRVDDYGIVDIEDLKKKATKDTVLASIMHANLEIGSIEPIREIGFVLKERDILFHSDGAGSCGRIPVDVNELLVDAMTVSAHEFYGPKGAGALYLRKGVAMRSIMQGGFQEMGYRPGTENVPAIVGLGEASRLAKAEMAERVGTLTPLGKKLWDGIAQSVDYLHFTGHPTLRLPGHVSFWIEFVEGESLLLWLNLNGVASASGSACASNVLAADEKGLKASHVLTAVGVPPEICHGSIAFSLGKDTTEADVDYTLSTLPSIVEKLREMSPLYQKATGGK